MNTFHANRRSRKLREDEDMGPVPRGELRRTVEPGVIARFAALRKGGSSVRYVNISLHFVSNRPSEFLSSRNGETKSLFGSELEILESGPDSRIGHRYEISAWASAELMERLERSGGVASMSTVFHEISWKAVMGSPRFSAAGKVDPISLGAFD
jgi:hypothetical protein